MNRILYVTDLEYREIESTGPSIEGKPFLSYMSQDAGIDIMKDADRANAERGKMVQQGRRPADEVRVVCISPIAFKRIGTVVLGNTGPSIMADMAGLRKNKLPIQLRPCEQKQIPPVVVKRSLSETIPVNMDRMVEDTAYTIELINEDGSTVEATKAGTSDALGKAVDSIDMPGVYAPATIILRLTQTVVKAVDYAELDADIVSTEDHVITKV